MFTESSRKRAVVITLIAAAGCNDGSSPTETILEPTGAVASIAAPDRVSEEIIPQALRSAAASDNAQRAEGDISTSDPEPIIAVLEKVAADPQLRELWVFDGTGGPTTLEETLDALYQVRAQVAMGSSALEPAAADPSYDACVLVGDSAFGATGTPPSSRVLLFYAFTRVFDPWTGEGCNPFQIGGESDIRLHDLLTGNSVHSHNMFFRAWFTSYASGMHNYTYAGPALYGSISTRHFASGLPDDHSGRSGHGL